MRYTVVRKLKEPDDPHFDKDYVEQYRETVMGYTEDMNMSLLACILLNATDKHGLFNYVVTHPRIGDYE